MTYQISEAELEDLPELLEVAKQAFLQAFTENNKIENVMAYLNEAFTIDKFLTEFQNPASSFLKLANESGIVGYVKINLTPAQTDVHDPDSLEISRLYLLDEFIGLGLGRMLLGQAIDFAKEKQKKYIWLGVWEHNQRAINFYRRNGFEKFGSHPFPFGDEVQTDWLMRKMI